MNAVIGSLLENLKAINIVEEKTLPVFSRDRLNTGDAREVTVKEFLEKYLPQTFKVKKGAIFALDAAQSNNIDCVVLAPAHPPLITPLREIIIAEGVYCAVEVKPDISVLTEKGELMRGLRQIQSVKRLEREVETLKFPGREELPDYFRKVPAVIFSLHSADLIQTTGFIRGLVHKQVLREDELPDLIVALDKGTIFYNPHLSRSIVKEVAANMPIPFWGDAGFALSITAQKEMILAMFLFYLMTFLPPQLFIGSFILWKYIKSALDGSGISLQPIPLHYFPPSMQEKFERLAG